MDQPGLDGNPHNLEGTSFKVSFNWGKKPQDSDSIETAPDGPESESCDLHATSLDPDPFPILIALHRAFGVFLTIVIVGVPTSLVVLGIVTGQTLETVFYMGFFGCLISAMLASSFRPKRTWLSRAVENAFAAAVRRQMEDRLNNGRASHEGKPIRETQGLLKPIGGVLPATSKPGILTFEPVKDRDVLAKTRQLIEYDRDPARPGRPIHLLVAGGLVAIGAFMFMVLFAYRAFYANTLPDDTAYLVIGLLFVIQTCGVYIFSYGYELYDVAKAIRLTAIISVFAVAVIGVLIVAFALLSKASSSSSDRSSSSGPGSKSSGRDFQPLFSALGSMIEDKLEARAEEKSHAGDKDSESSGPFAIRCSRCGTEFSPTPPDALCPSCGHSALAQPVSS